MKALPVSELQLERVNALLQALWECNPFYAAKWQAAGLRWFPLRDLAELKAYPFTTRVGLLSDQSAAPPLGTNLSCSLDHFKRFYRSSGNSRAPLFWGDTARSWHWAGFASMQLLVMSEIKPADRVF